MAKQREGETLTHTPQMELRDVFMIHSDLDDVLLAEESLIEAHTVGGVEVNPLTLRIKARYAVADAMLRVRGES